MTSSIGSNYGAMAMMHRPDPSQMASRLFSKLDTKNQGYIEKSDLQSAFAQISGSGGSGSSVNVDDVFKQFDSDSDGKITKDEMTSGIKKLADELDSQFSQMRMSGFGGHGHHGGMQAMGGMPPQGDHDGDDGGFTKDELTSQLQEMGSSDSKRASLISNIVNNFDKADTDGDGKVTRNEAMAFDKASKASSADSSSSASAATTQAGSGELQVMRKIMQLMHAYGGQGQDSAQSAMAGVLSVSA